MNAFKKAGGSGKKKRDLFDLLEEREYYEDLEELLARGPAMSKLAGQAGKEIYTAVGQNYLQGKFKDATKQDPKIPQGLKDAAALA